MDYRTLIDASTLQQTLQQDLADNRAPNWVLLDCRFNLIQPDAGRALYRQGHIPTAQYADLNLDLSSPITATSGRHPLPDPKRLAQRLGQWGIGPDTQVVVYDDMGGAMASRGWWLLRWLGHDRVALLDGGLPAWIAAGGELSAAASQPAPCAAYPLALHRNWVVGCEAVVANLAGQSFTLIDARNVERFRGEQEPIDPVAGRVPGALNRPVPDNLTATGRFKPADQLRVEWLALLGDVESDQVVTMCGSGVTACHLLLSLELAGLSGARLYAGSWSEWIRDANRPVEVG
jgi:thiosulfate/3-mercaptopyruvate sulfurtransferase